MDEQAPGSVSRWIVGLKADHDGAAQELWNRYFSQLVAVAHRRLQGAGRESDEEDVALSALKSAMLGVQHDRFPRLNDRTELWPLLVTLTARKAVDAIRRQSALKRKAAASLEVDQWRQVIGDEPSPDFALRVAESLEAIVQSLGDPALRLIAQRKLEGYDNEEIARELNVSSRTVVRKLARIRQEWEEGDRD